MSCRMVSKRQVLQLQMQTWQEAMVQQIRLELTRLHMLLSPVVVKPHSPRSDAPWETLV